MSYVMDMLTPTKLRKELSQVLKNIEERNRPVLIPTKRRGVVLVSVEEWNSMQQKLDLLSGRAAVKDLREGTATPPGECINPPPSEK